MIGRSKRARRERVEIHHAADCPVSQPDFVPDPDWHKSFCTCDFLNRLRKYIERKGEP